MSRTHNKKRNVGLIYEFLVTTVSRALIEGDERRSALGMKILRRHFKPGSELYKEFRLVNALRRTSVSSEQIAGGILAEAKAAARKHDVMELDRQKSFLIHDINKSFGDGGFYDQQVAEYKLLATVQTLLNDWRASDPDLSRIASYEQELLKHLTTPHAAPDAAVATTAPGEARFIMNAMMKRLNERYGATLNPTQRALARSYALSTSSDDPTSIMNRLTEVRSSLLRAIDEHVARNGDDKYVNGMLADVRARIEKESLATVDDDTVARFMMYSKLHEELTTGDDGNG